jgi:class 3 adenylate cyclase/tetratricopeptide (TPR) repeat protein
MEETRSQPLEPEMRVRRVAVLFGDIAGFTKLGEKLAAQGNRGAEELSRVLEAYLGRLVSIVALHGGEIVRFAGDAPIVLWSGDDSLEAATRRAAQCALDLQAQLHDHVVTEGSALGLRIGVSAGTVTEAIVGGGQGRWEYVVLGRPIVEAGAAQSGAALGQVVATAAAWQWLEASCQREQARVVAVRDPLPLEPLIYPQLSPEATRRAAAFVSRALTARLEAGHADWLPELRRVSVLFVSLEGLDESGPDALDRLQAATRVLQAAVYQLDGSVNQFLVDDKGTVLLAVWGVPTRTHEDDPARAVLAGRQILAGLRSLGMKASAGVSTGRVFCGFRGGAARRDYAVMGATVNLAARLMGLGDGSVMTDETTANAAASRLAFEALPAKQIKGKHQPVIPYRALTTVVRAEVHPATPVFGRRAEQEILNRALFGLTQRRGSVVVLEGEAGIGKSCLTLAFERDARAQGVQILHGATDGMEHATPYFAWRAVVAGLFGLADTDELPRRREVVLQRLQQEPAWTPLAAFLNPFLGTDFADSELTASMQSEGRSQGTQNLVLGLLLKASAARPTLLIVDDLHRLDSSSWELLRLLVVDGLPLLLLVTTRPLAQGPNTAYEVLVRAAGTGHLVLGPLSPDGTFELVCHRLGVRRLSPPIERFLTEKAEGHPFFSEEIACVLRDTGLLVIEGDEAQLAPQAGDLFALGLPSTLEGIIGSRIDRLTQAQQLTLKAASVIGRAFTHFLLRAVHPIAGERALLPRQLETLTQLDLTLLDPGVGDADAYLFKHVVTQETAYNLLLFAQRRQLHQVIAEWYERNFAGDLTPYRGLLAHHWVRAEVPAKAMDALEKAGEQALQSHANSEAADFFAQALHIGSTEHVPMPRRAHWELLRCEALYKIGRFEESLVGARHVSALLGHPVPETPLRRVTGTLKALARVLVRRQAPRMPIVRSDSGDQRLLEAAQAHGIVISVSFWAADALTMMYATITCVDLAERFGPCSVLVRGYAGMALVLGVVPLHSLARAYGAKAVALGEAIGDADSLAFARFLCGLYLSGAGRLDEAAAQLKLAFEDYERLGDGRRFEDASNVYSSVLYYQGHWSMATTVAEEGHQSAKRRGDPQSIVAPLILTAIMLARRGDHEGALRAFLRIPLAPGDHVSRIDVQGEIALLYVQLGRFEDARVAAEEVAGLLSGRRPATVGVLVGTLAFAEACRELWVRAVKLGLPEAPSLQRAAWSAVGSLAVLAKVFPLAEAGAQLKRGAFELVRGRLRRARFEFTRALENARGMGMVIHILEAHERLCAVTDGAEQEEHARKAASLRKQVLAGPG